MTEITTKKAAESGHWYTRDAQCIEHVRGKNGKMRKPTIRDARAQDEPWLPGVTTIVRCAAAPQLTRWSNKQHVMAATVLGPPKQHVDAGSQCYRAEGVDEYFERVSDYAMKDTREAADIGSDIHGMIERYIEHGVHSDAAKAIMDTVEESMPADMDWQWKSETPCSHFNGYATKADLWSPYGYLIDFKGKESVDKFPTTVYDEHVMQLAATRDALEYTFEEADDRDIIGLGKTAIVYFSRHPDELGQAQVAWVDADRIIQGGAMFRGLLTYWQFKNNHHCGWEPRDLD